MTTTASGRCTARLLGRGEVEVARVSSVDEPGEPREQGHGSEREQCGRTRHQRRNPAPAARRGSLIPRRGTRGAGASEAPHRRGDQPDDGDERGCPEDPPLPGRRAARDTNEPEVPPGRDPAPEVKRLAVVGEKQAGLDFGEAVTNGRVRVVVGLEVGDAGVDDEPVRRTTQVEVTPRRHSVEAGVGRPAGGLSLPSRPWRRRRRGSPSRPGARRRCSRRRPAAATAVRAADRDTRQAR